MKVNEFLKRRRKIMDLTLDDIADACEVTKATVSRWESGEINNIGSNKIKSLAETLKIRPSLLIEEEIAENQELLKHFIREMKKRQASMDPPITKAERNLKRMENE